MAKVTIVRSDLTSVLEDVLLKELELDVQNKKSGESTSVPKRELRKLIDCSLDEFFNLTRFLKNRLWDIEELLENPSIHPMNKERLEEELNYLKPWLKDLED